MSLSEKEILSLSNKAKQHDSILCEQYYDEKDVKEAVKELKEILKLDLVYGREKYPTEIIILVLERIDKIFGEKLI